MTDSDQVVCAGDLLDFGSFPGKTIGLVREKRIRYIRGNHEAWAVAEGQDMSGWDLTPRTVWFLESLPVIWAKVTAGVRVVVWHARPGSDMQGIDPVADPSKLGDMLDAAGAGTSLSSGTCRRRCASLPGTFESRRRCRSSVTSAAPVVCGVGAGAARITRKQPGPLVVLLVSMPKPLGATSSNLVGAYAASRHALATTGRRQADTDGSSK
jgi:hypothetical protein